MKKILAVCFVLMTTNIFASDKYDVKVVESYIKVTDSLRFGEGLSTNDEAKKDSLKYAQMTLTYMKKHKMDMNSLLGARVYTALGVSLYKLKKVKKGRGYVMKAYEIRKNILGEGDPQTKDLKNVLDLWEMFDK